MKVINGNEITQFLSETVATPTWVPIQRTDGSVMDTFAFTQSAQVDPTRQASEQVATEVSVAGSIEGEFPFADNGLQLFIKSAMQNVYETVVVSATVAFSGTDMTSTGSAFANLEVGDFFVPFGATLNGSALFVITAKADDDTVSLSPTPQAETAQVVSFSIKSISNSNQVQQLSFQERIKTQSDTLYNTFNDVLVSSMELTAATGALITLSTSILGLERLNQNTQVSGSTDATASDARVIGSVKGFDKIFVDQSVVDDTKMCPTDFSINIDNGSTAEYCLGKLGAAVITSPSITVTGTLNSFVDSTSVETLLSEKTKLRDETKFSMGVSFKDGNGNFIVFDMPYCVYTEQDMPARSNGTSLKNEGTFSADGKGSLGYTVRMTYLAKP